MITQIMTGLDRAKSSGFVAFRSMMAALAAARHLEIHWEVAPSPVPARIDFGRWVVDCECGGANYAEPTDPIFFCLSCGNKGTGGHVRPVIFPEGREAIEMEVLTRPVSEPAGLSPADTALNSTPMIPGLSRSWKPGETVDQLKAQRIAALKAAEG